jgi:hypothetical protein
MIFQMGTKSPNQSSDFRSDFPNGGQIVEIKARFFLPKNPKKKLDSEISQFKKPQIPFREEMAYGN